MTARLTEKAKYHFDAEMCTSIAEAVELAHATPAAACWSAAVKLPRWKRPNCW